MVIVRNAQASDLERIAAIYAHHVLTGTASFDTEPRSLAVWQKKLAEIDESGWPFLVAVEDAQVIGYAYATQFRDRAAYSYSCEDSIYIDAARLGRGVGSALLGRLMDAARQSGFRQVIAVIGGAEPGSIALHAKCGFEQVGRLRNVGHKFGRLLDTVYMQRSV